MKFIAQPDDAFRLGDFLTESLSGQDWTEFRAAVAFVKRSGTKHVMPGLTEFSKRALVNISVGINSGGSSLEGLQDLISAIFPAGKLWVFHNVNGSTFHPKIYLFKNSSAADLVIGSGNLTEGGLYTNYEGTVRLRLDLAIAEHRAMLASVDAALDRWSTPRPGICFALDTAFLRILTESGKVPDEAHAKESEEELSAAKAGGIAVGSSPFKSVRVRPAPRAPTHPGQIRSARDEKALEVTPVTAASGVGAATSSKSTTGGLRFARTFLMTLQKTDVGYGQVTSGTARRSPEIFVPIGAVDQYPDFWGWPHLFVIDKAWEKEHAEWIARKKAGGRRSTRPLTKMDRNGVKFRIGGTRSPVQAPIWYNPDKVDIRIRHEKLRAAGKVGDILVLTKAPRGATYDYEFEVVRQTDSRFAALNAQCNIKVAANSRKRYLYV